MDIHGFNGKSLSCERFLTSTTQFVGSCYYSRRPVRPEHRAAKHADGERMREPIQNHATI